MSSAKVDTHTQLAAAAPNPAARRGLLVPVPLSAELASGNHSVLVVASKRIPSQPQHAWWSGLLAFKPEPGRSPMSDVGSSKCNSSVLRPLPIVGLDDGLHSVARELKVAFVTSMTDVPMQVCWHVVQPSTGCELLSHSGQAASACPCSCVCVCACAAPFTASFCSALDTRVATLLAVLELLATIHRLRSVRGKSWRLAGPV